MSPITHGLVAWTLAAGLRERRDRALVLLAGVVPDLDGIGLPIDLLGRVSGAWTTDYWGQWHHEVGHTLGWALVTTGVATALAKRRVVVAVTAFAAFHLHLLGDLVGGRGPDGYQWPIPWLSPFSEAPRLTWAGQWELNAWPNIAITGVLLGGTFAFGWRRGRTPLGLLSERADAVLVETLRRRFGAPSD